MLIIWKFTRSIASRTKRPGGPNAARPSGSRVRDPCCVRSHSCSRHFLCSVFLFASRSHCVWLPDCSFSHTEVFARHACQRPCFRVILQVRSIPFLTHAWWHLPHFLNMRKQANKFVWNSCGTASRCRSTMQSFFVAATVCFFRCISLSQQLGFNTRQTITWRAKKRRGLLAEER